VLTAVLTNNRRVLGPHVADRCLQGDATWHQAQ
jgi:hypothetical protein